MGEDETIDFESRRKTLVFCFWNMDDYPIPVDNTDDLGPIFCDILKALDLMGFRDGFMDVILYSEQHNYDKKRGRYSPPMLTPTETPHNNTLFCFSHFYFSYM
ncbi:hypothetical protein Bca4012_047377 [Brassica carinata]